MEIVSTIESGENCVWAVNLSILHSSSHLTMTCIPFLSPLPLFLSPHPLHTSFLSLSTQPPHLTSPIHLVTMQIYLSPLARKTGSSEDAKLAARVPASSGSTASPHAKGGSKMQGRKTPPTFPLNLKKKTKSQHTLQDDCVYKSPVKSPSQYFQICYWTILLSLNNPKRSTSIVFFPTSVCQKSCLVCCL